MRKRRNIFGLIGLILLAMVCTIIPATTSEAKKKNNKSQIPDTVLEYAEEYDDIMIVDLDDQHVYCVVGGEVIADSDCVSGDLETSPTPTGLYDVWYKNSDFYMKDRYYTAYATFFNDGIAIHDADAWRDEYGGDIYQWGGSHGCINTPRWFAKIVYNNTQIGTPVYVY